MIDKDSFIGQSEKFVFIHKLKERVLNLCAEVNNADQSTLVNLEIMSNCNSLTLTGDDTMIFSARLYKLLGFYCKPNMDCELIETTLFVLETTGDEGRMINIVDMDSSKADINYRNETSNDLHFGDDYKALMTEAWKSSSSIPEMSVYDLLFQFSEFTYDATTFFENT